MAALAGLRPLPDLDLDEVGRVEHLRGDAEAPGCHLLAAPEWVLAVHVTDLATLSVDADDVQPHGGLGIRAEGDLALRSKRHRGDHDRVRVVADPGVDVRRVDRLAV